MSEKLDRVGCVNNTIITASGRYFDYNNPLAEQIDIHDIARALGNTCRFGGHCQFYSVAEHSVHCYQIANREYPDNVELRKHALLHDAAEAYIGDMPKPLKLMMPEFRELENAVEAVLRFKFGLRDSFDDAVKRIDMCMLKAEKVRLFPDDQLTWLGFNDLPDIDVSIERWDPTLSAERFLEAFGESCNGCEHR